MLAVALLVVAACTSTREPLTSDSTAAPQSSQSSSASSLPLDDSAPPVPQLDGNSLSMGHLAAVVLLPEDVPDAHGAVELAQGHTRAYENAVLVRRAEDPADAFLAVDLSERVTGFVSALWGQDDTTPELVSVTSWVSLHEDVSGAKLALMTTEAKPALGSVGGFEVENGEPVSGLGDEAQIVTGRHIWLDPPVPRAEVTVRVDRATATVSVVGGHDPELIVRDLAPVIAGRLQALMSSDPPARTLPIPDVYVAPIDALDSFAHHAAFVVTRDDGSVLMRQESSGEFQAPDRATCRSTGEIAGTNLPAAVSVVDAETRSVTNQGTVLSLRRFDPQGFFDSDTCAGLATFWDNNTSWSGNPDLMASVTETREGRSVQVYATNDPDVLEDAVGLSYDEDPSGIEFEMALDSDGWIASFNYTTSNAAESMADWLPVFEAYGVALHPDETIRITISAAISRFNDETITVPAPGQGRALKLGTLLPQTGDLAVLGPPMVEAVNMAIRDINDAGGVNGDDVELIVGDSGTNEQVAAEMADRLINSDQVDGIIGPASSRITLSVIDKITSSGTPMCSPSNTGSVLTNYEADVPGFYFRTGPPDNLQGQALADVILVDGHRRVAVVALNDEYGQGFARFLKSALAEGGATLAVDVAYDPDGRDFSVDIQHVVDAAPDAVALISFPDTGTPILDGLIESGLRPDMLYTADGMQSSSVIGQVGTGVLNGMKGTAPSAHGTQKFIDDFTEFAPGVRAIFSAHAYDCVIIMALAAESARSANPADIAAAMVDVTKGGTKCDSFSSCKKILDNDGDIDYDGASGPGEWVPQGEPSVGSYDVWEFRDGRIVNLDIIEAG